MKSLMKGYGRDKGLGYTDIEQCITISRVRAILRLFYKMKVKLQQKD
jgi:hypothetical protein